MGSHYYDIDRIIASSQDVPCKFLVDAHDVAFLDTSRSSRSLEQDSNSSETRTDKVRRNTQLPLPLWLVQVLYAYGVVEVATPEYLKPYYQKWIQPAPRNCNLGDIDYYYYRTVVAYAAINEKDRSRVLENARVFLKRRYLEMLKKSHRFRSQSFYRLIERLGHLERELFDAKMCADRHFHSWREGALYLLGPCEPIRDILRKRKIRSQK